MHTCYHSREFLWLLCLLLIPLRGYHVFLQCRLLHLKKDVHWHKQYLVCMNVSVWKNVTRYIFSYFCGQISSAASRLHINRNITNKTIEHTEAITSCHTSTENLLAWRILCYVENWQIYMLTDVDSSQIYKFAALHAGCENVHHCHSLAVDPQSRFPNVCNSRARSLCLFII